MPLPRICAVSRPDWSRPLPRPLTIPEVMKLATLDDVRVLMQKHLPAEYRAELGCASYCMLRRSAEQDRLRGAGDGAAIGTQARRRHVSLEPRRFPAPWDIEEVRPMLHCPSVLSPTVRLI